MNLRDLAAKLDGGTPARWRDLAWLEELSGIHPTQEAMLIGFRRRGTLPFLAAALAPVAGTRIVAVDTSHPEYPFAELERRLSIAGAKQVQLYCQPERGIPDHLLQLCLDEPHTQFDLIYLEPVRRVADVLATMLLVQTRLSADGLFIVDNNATTLDWVHPEPTTLKQLTEICLSWQSGFAPPRHFGKTSFFRRRDPALSPEAGLYAAISTTLDEARRNPELRAELQDSPATVLSRYGWQEGAKLTIEIEETDRYTPLPPSFRDAHHLVVPLELPAWETGLTRQDLLQLLRG